jgi:phosphotransferase system IIB component
MIVKLFFIATEGSYQVIINTKKKNNRKDFIKDKTERDVAPLDC